MKRSELRQLIREIISEVETSEIDFQQLEKDLAGSVDLFTKELSKKKSEIVVQESNLSEQELNESAIITITGVALAIPKILELVAWLIKKFSKYFQKMLGVIDPKDPASVEKIKQIAEKIHHTYLNTLVGIYRMFGVKDNIKSKKLAEVTLSLVLAGLFISSGAGAIQAAKSAHVTLAGFETFLAGIKASELTGQAAPVVMNVISKVVGTV